MERPSRGYVLLIRVRGYEGVMERLCIMNEGKGRWRGYVIGIRVRCDGEAFKRLCNMN